MCAVLRFECSSTFLFLASVEQKIEYRVFGNRTSLFLLILCTRWLLIEIFHRLDIFRSLHKYSRSGILTLSYAKFHRFPESYRGRLLHLYVITESCWFLTSPVVSYTSVSYIKCCYDFRVMDDSSLCFQSAQTILYSRIPSSIWCCNESVASWQALGCSSLLCVMWFAASLSRFSRSLFYILRRSRRAEYFVIESLFLRYRSKFLPNWICCCRKKSAKTLSDERLYFPFAWYFPIWRTWSVMCLRPIRYDLLC